MTRLVLAFALVVVAAPLGAQIGTPPSGRCALELSFDRLPSAIKLPSGQRNIFVAGNVVIVTTEGKRLTSPHMRYQQATNEVSSDSAFTLVEPGRSLRGIGFRADPQLTRVVVLKAGEGRGNITLPAQ